MVTSIVFIAFIGTLQFNSAISAAIDYEPIKITVNENFNAQPGQVSTELQDPAVVHQGANFYFKPQLNLSPSYIPSHIEALMSLIQQHHDACAKDTSKIVVDKDKLVQILKPFMYPLSDISKETLSEIVLEKENNLEIVKPIIITEEPKPATPELLVIPEAPVLPPLSFKGGIPSVEHLVKKEESVILEESTGVLPEQTIIEVEPKPVIQKVAEIPEAPVLPILSLHDISSIIEEEVNKEVSIISEEQTGVLPTIPEIDVPITEPIINYIETKPITSGLVVIPEPPVLPPLPLNGIPPIIEGEMKKEESIILEESTDVLPETTIIKVGPKPVIQKLAAIPKPPVLPSLSVHDISSIVEEEVKKEESIISEEQTGVFPTIPEIYVRPITEPIINYIETNPITSDLVVIPEPPVLPPLPLKGIPPIIEGEIKKEESIILEESTDVLPETTIIKVGPKPVIQKLAAIPKPPVLPSLSVHDISSIVEEEVKKEESIISEEQTGVFPTIPEIYVRPITEPIINYIETNPITSDLVVIPEPPVLPPLPLNGIPPIIEGEMKKEESIILEGSTDVLPETTIIKVGPKPVIQKLAAIPKPPVLPSLSVHDISSIVEEEVKKEESIISEEQTGVFPTIPEIYVRPITEPIINYIETNPITSDLVVNPEPPVLPPLPLNGIPPIIEGEMKKEESIILEESTDVLPETTIIKMGPKPVIQKLAAIPKPPVLPSFSVHDISSIVEEEVKKEESIISEEQTGVFPTIPEINVRPITEPIINYIETKPITSELVVIPQAPVLPPLSYNGIPPIVEGEVKKEESVILQESTGILPEPPVLPSLSLHDISSIIEEEVKKEESIILEEQTGVFPTIPEIDVRPITEPIINYTETKLITSGIITIPEAPVLPPLSFNGIPPVAEEELIISEGPAPGFPAIPNQVVSSFPEPIINYVEPKPITPELVVIPEAPVLSSLSYNGITPAVEEVKIKKSIKVEESTGVFPTISEISTRPLPEPSVVSETVESFALENKNFPIATEEVKIEVPILFEESIEVFPPIVEISSGPTLEESEITHSYVLEEENAVAVKETLPPTIIPKPSNNLGVFSYVPFVSHLSNRAPKTKKLIIPKPASLERFLLKKHPFRLPLTPFPKLDLNAIKSSIWGNKKQFLYPTSYAHDVVEKRIAPNMAFKKQNAPKRVKIYIRSNVPKGPSYL